jgi:hypothetical protein
MDVMKESVAGTVTNPRVVFLGSCGPYLAQGLVIFNSGVYRILKREVVSPGWDLRPSLSHSCVLSTGKPLKLSLAAEEVATFYGKMLHLECTSKEVFRRNFFSDWRKVCFSAAPAAALAVASVCPAWLHPR